MANRTEIIISARDESKIAFDSVSKSLNKIQAEAKRLNASNALNLNLGNFVKGGLYAGAAAASVEAVKGFVRMNEELIKLNGILKNSAGGNIVFGQSLQDVRNIASSAQVDLLGIGTTYARISNSLKDLGVDQKQVSDITETLSLALKVNGATATESSSTLLQLSQAFGSGKLAGDEFRAAMEAAPNVMRQLAQSLNVPFGSLKELAAQGQLTSDVLLKAFTDQKFLESLRLQAAQMKTVEGSMQQLNNSVQLLAGDFNKATGFSNLLAEGISGIAGAFEMASDVINNKPIDWAKALPGGGKSLIIDKEGKVVIDFLSNLERQSDTTGKALRNLNTIPTISWDAGDIGSIKDYQEALSRGSEAVSKFLNNPSFSTKAENQKKQLLDLANAFKEAVKDVPQGSEKYLEALKHVKEKEKEILNEGKSTGKSDAQKKLEEQARAAQDFTDKLKEQAATLGITGTALLQFDAAQLKLTESQKQSVNASILSIENFEKNKKAIEDATKAAEFQQELMRQIGEDSQKQAQLDAEPARKAQESYMSFMEAIRVESENLNIELIKDDKARIKAQLELEHQRSVDRINGLGLESEQAQALIEAEAELFKKKIENIDKSAKGTKNIAQELGLTFTSAFEDAALSGEKFSDVLAGLAKDIERMALRKAVTEPLGEIFKGFDIGSFDFGSIFANGNGGVYSGAGISAYSGQVVNTPTLFPFAKGVGLMGEAGPEAIMPLKRGRGGKLGIEGGSNTIVNVYNNANGTQATATEKNDNGVRVIDIFIDQVKDSLNSDVNRGTGSWLNSLQTKFALNPAVGAMR